MRASAAIALAPAIPYFRSTPQTYRLALIGAGWWGNNILREALAPGNAKVVGICDVDERALRDTQKNIDEWTGDKPKHYRDFRELLAEQKPDIAIIGTPDHWHALPAIAAMEAGAHIYIEKPIGHTINEGKAILRAARDTGRVAQVGTHRRVSPHNVAAREFFKSGKVGKLSAIKCFVNYGGGPGEAQAPIEPPKELDWDFWVGPAPMQPYRPGIHPRGFRNYLDFANGTMGDWGIHWFDQVLWCVEEHYPKTVFSSGGRFVRNDSSDAPDTQHAVFQFEEFTLTWEHRLCAPSANEDHNVGCYFHGTEGVLHIGWLDGFTFYPRKKDEAPLRVPPGLHQPDDQNIKELWADFLDAIEHQRRPLSDIEHGHLASNISLLGMISYKLGRSLRWDGEKEIIIDDPEANALLSRPYRAPWVYPE
jgi:predicted dehydrogenase